MKNSQQKGISSKANNEDLYNFIDKNLQIMRYNLKVIFIKIKNKK